MGGWSHFTANLSKTAGASGAQLLIMLIATPIMTRLFAPEAYAAFGIINTAATVVVAIGLLTLPNAYTAETEPRLREVILGAMVQLLGIVVLCAALGVGITVLVQGHVALGISAGAMLLLPLLVLGYGLRQIVNNIAIQQGMFGTLSFSQVAEALCARGGSIALGSVLGGSPLYVLCAALGGYVIAARMLLRRLPRELYAGWRSLALRPGILREALAQVGDFALYGTAAQQVQQLVMLGLQVGIAGMFSNHLAGQYILAVSILTMPVSIVALATAPVVYHRFIAIFSQTPEGLLRAFLSASVLYMVVGMLVLLPLCYVGERLFGFVFGDIWRHAGVIAGVLAPAYLGVFVLTGVQSIFMVTRRLQLQFLVELLTALPAFATALYCFSTMAFDRALLYLSWLWVARALLLFAACFWVARGHDRVKGRR